MQRSPEATCVAIAANGNALTQTVAASSLIRRGPLWSAPSRMMMLVLRACAAVLFSMVIASIPAGDRREGMLALIREAVKDAREVPIWLIALDEPPKRGAAQPPSADPCRFSRPCRGGRRGSPARATARAAAW